MDREGLLSICILQNTAPAGRMPKNELVVNCRAFYRKRTVGYNRLYAAMGANKEISLLVRCFNTPVPSYTEQLYVIFDSGEQFRVSAIQEIIEDGAIDLTLSNVEEYLDVANNSE